MRTSERLHGLKAWVIKELCEGRKLKAPGEKNDITKIRRQEPGCFIGFLPLKQGQVTEPEPDPNTVVPYILIMLNPSKAKYVEDKRWDRKDDVHRSKEMGQTLSVTLMFAIYEPGERMQGFVKDDGTMDMTLITDGTEEGIITLFDWMDDCKQALLNLSFIPETDLNVNAESVIYSPYIDQECIVDRRPFFYGFVNVEFNCYSNDGLNTEIQSILD